MAPSGAEEKKALLAWYADTRPLTVDIVGDFAGSEVFLVHGESLIRHCFAESKVDFDTGFQLLHAVYAVEHFLSDLVKRGCNFDIVFFRDLRHLCVPAGHDASNSYKYQLARSIIIRHLSRARPDVPEQATSTKVLDVESPESPAFEEYLRNQSIRFVLCDDGGETEDPDAFQLRSLICQFLSVGKNVALFNSIEMKSSKIFAPLLGSENECPASITDAASSALERHGEAAPELKSLSDGIRSLDISSAGLTRDSLAIQFCKTIRQHEIEEKQSASIETDQRIQALLLHNAMLQHSSLSERSFPSISQEDSKFAQTDSRFLAEFSEACQAQVEKCGLDDENRATEWDLYDLIDGRLYLTFLDKVRKGEAFPEAIVQAGRKLWEVVAAKGDFNISTRPISASPHAGPKSPPPALKFEHPVFEDYLKDIKLGEASETTDATSGAVFEDLHHWHSGKPILTGKKQPVKLDEWALRRNQKFMAEIIAYAASLTNSRGKMLNPETIVLAPKRSNGKPTQPKPTAEKKAKETNKKETNKKTNKKAPQKGGLESALKAAKTGQDRKAQDQHERVVRVWLERCAEMEKELSSTKKYSTAKRFLLDQSDDGVRSLGSEVHLYMTRVLGRIWDQIYGTPKREPTSGMYLIAMMWNLMQEISKGPSTQAVADAVQKILSNLNFPSLPLSIGDQTRKLPFHIDYQAFSHAGKVVKDHRALQLEYAGPYMDRRFDPQPDERVPFEPDSWQRDVLDAIDADNSLLVVAPTSAGKTFISFYAMKKVLEESDDGVLVYVAPTKALVNQIGAEIQARYNKTYREKGKSVWAIHTRDYKINSPTKCQILVTVPHILQIMLMSPANAADGPRAWSKRINRIIFDEVHCIGQAEDGVVWEQLLLLAPCPIIALSATVGNPKEFRDWLSLSQEKKGYKMDMIVHETRYSELRKFTYEPPQRSFEGLQKPQRLPVPGLDEGHADAANFHFVHPVTALADRNRGALNDVSFESRDCYTLWAKMKDILSPEDMKRLDVWEPSKALPEIITKFDVLRWERNLKSALRDVMGAPDATFQKLRDSLSESPRSKQRAVDKAAIVANRTSGRTARQSHIEDLFLLACDLNAQDALPGIVFNYDRIVCEDAARLVHDKLAAAETEWKDTSSEWARKLRDFENWKETQKAKGPVRQGKAAGQDATRMSKLEAMKEEGSVDRSQWEIFDPEAPLTQFSFADSSRVQRTELNELTRRLDRNRIPQWLFDALKRGVGVHHAGMNRRYRQLVEVLFRKGYLRLVVATGTLALGINMPCKTVVFSGDSVALTAQNYRQASGRAGRRGFDLLGNIVFNGIPRDRVDDIMSSRLPDLRGQFPVSTSLILRLFALLHGTNNSEFAVNAVHALLSQTHLYLGGPESKLAIKNHVRFSIEYLRRQYLLSPTGTPLNFSPLVGHLYFTENSVFAFHALLKGGYFHKLCADIESNQSKVLVELMLVLSHLFNRIPVRRNPVLEETAQRSTSIIFLPRLPRNAEQILMDHNQETLDIFKGYVRSYIDNSLGDKPDRTLPFTGIAVGADSPKLGDFPDGGAEATIRSSFVALSGLRDNFQSISELCSTTREGVFLEESAIPYIPIWPQDTSIETNSYVYDFYKHGSMEVLVKDNRIIGGDVWFHLKDFSMTLATIVASLKSLAGLIGDDDDVAIGLEDNGDEADEEVEVEEEVSKPAMPTELPKTVKKKKAKVADSWDDSDDDDAAAAGGGDASSDEDTPSGTVGSEMPAWQASGSGLMHVLKAFALLREEFDTKFKEVWA